MTQSAVRFGVFYRATLSPFPRPNGNLTTDDQGHTLVYDAWNRLVTVKNGGTTLTSYKYDAMSRKIVENPGTVNDLYYSANWQVLEERSGGVSTATIQYVWSPVYVDALIERDRSTQNNGTMDERLYAQQDANWNVTALVNTSGSVVERYVYDTYGKPTFLNTSWTTLGGRAEAEAPMRGGICIREDATIRQDYFTTFACDITARHWEDGCRLIRLDSLQEIQTYIVL